MINSGGNNRMYKILESFIVAVIVIVVIELIQSKIKS